MPDTTTRGPQSDAKAPDPAAGVNGWVDGTKALSGPVWAAQDETCPWCGFPLTELGSAWVHAYPADAAFCAEYRRGEPGYA